MTFFRLFNFEYLIAKKVSMAKIGGFGSSGFTMKLFKISTDEIREERDFHASVFIFHFHIILELFFHLLLYLRS